jgi:hypothetical protein
VNARRIEITLSQERWEQLEAARGHEPRAAFIKRALENVAAVKTLLDELRREADAGDNGSEFDELDNVTPIRREA